MEQRRRVYRTNSRRTNVPNVDPAVIAALQLGCMTVMLAMGGTVIQTPLSIFCMENH